VKSVFGGELFYPLEKEKKGLKRLTASGLQIGGLKVSFD
jgi:hypothetical protein